MKVTLRPTRKVIKFIVNGAEVPVRIWEGETEKGVACHAYITRIAVGTKEDASEFERDLQEVQSPSAEIEALPARLIL